MIIVVFLWKLNGLAWKIAKPSIATPMASACGSQSAAAAYHLPGW